MKIFICSEEYQTRYKALEAREEIGKYEILTDHCEACNEPHQFYTATCRECGELGCKYFFTVRKFGSRLKPEENREGFGLRLYIPDTKRYCAKCFFDKILPALKLGVEIF